MANEKVEKFMWDILKLREFNLALITAHAKLGIGSRGGNKAFSTPMKSMAIRTLNNHLSKAMNLPCRIKGMSSNRKTQKLRL